MTDFVPVPVPSEHVLAVMRYLTELTAADTNGTVPPPPLSPGASPSDGGIWSLPNLQRLARGENISTTTVVKILDELSITPFTPGDPNGPVPLVDLADRIGVTPDNLRGSLSGFTRHMRNRYPDQADWPFGWERGPRADLPNPTEYHYFMTPKQAQQWLHARTQPDATTDDE